MRCSWCEKDPLYQRYHDEEWGKPVYDETALFEFLCLEGQQAGLNWLTILKKRPHYRRLFNHFDAEKITRYDNKKIKTLLSEPGIIRHRLKIEAIIKNAKAFLALKEKGDSFSDFIWQFVDHIPLQNDWKRLSDVPITTSVSDKMTKELKKNQFVFVGSVTCYAYMQAVGMVNDHLITCFRHREIKSALAFYNSRRTIFCDTP